MTRIYEGEMFTVDVDPGERWVWIARTSRSSREEGELRSTLDGLAAALAPLPIARMRAVIDMRQAPGRNDETFEQKVVPAFRGIVGRFSRIAFLVATQVGKMQIQRLEKAPGQVEAFTDEAEAQRFARGER